MPGGCMTFGAELGTIEGIEYGDHRVLPEPVCPCFTSWGYHHPRTG